MHPSSLFVITTTLNIEIKQTANVFIVCKKNTHIQQKKQHTGLINKESK